MVTFHDGQETVNISLHFALLVNSGYSNCCSSSCLLILWLFLCLIWSSGVFSPACGSWLYLLTFPMQQSVLFLSVEVTECNIKKKNNNNNKWKVDWECGQSSGWKGTEESLLSQKNLRQCWATVVSVNEASECLGTGSGQTSMAGLS